MESWFAMRDLTRANALNPAYLRLGEAGFRVFTPMVWKVFGNGSHKQRRLVPAIHDLLFVRSERRLLDPLVETIPTLQYRYVKGGTYCQAMTVPDSDMDRFIHAVEQSDEPRYFMPGEIRPEMIGRRVRIIGGPLNGFEGNLLSIRGMRKRRLLIDIPDMLTAAVEVLPDYIEFL